MRNIFLCSVFLTFFGHNKTKGELCLRSPLLSSIVLLIFMMTVAYHTRTTYTIRICLFLRIFLIQADFPDKHIEIHIRHFTIRLTLHYMDMCISWILHAHHYTGVIYWWAKSLRKWFLLPRWWAISPGWSRPRRNNEATNHFPMEDTVHTEQFA